MGVRVNLKNVPDANAGGAVSIGKYPCRLRIDAYQTDQQGNLMLDGDGNRVFWRSSNGDVQWKLRAELLDGPFKGRKLFDQLTFSAGGLKRIKVLVVRGGFASGEEENFEIEPEDLDGSLWYVDVDRHEVATGRDGKPKDSKYTFKRGSCICETCRIYDGKNVNVNSRIAFAGFELMDAETAARLTKAEAASGRAEASGGGAVAADGGAAAENDDPLPF